MEYIVIVLCLILLLSVFRFSKRMLYSYRFQINEFIIKIILFLKDWRNALSFGIAWLITNGWGWVFMFLGRFLHIKWMRYAGDAYIAFLWLPFVNEKVVTIALAVFIKKTFFKRNERNETA